MILLIASIVFGFIYSCFIGYHTIAWSSKEQSTLAATKPVSIIIVARNEELNILSTLESIAANDYPHELYEIILVDDHSTDDTIAVANATGISNLKVVSLADKDLSRFGKAFKKAGQYYGIQSSSCPTILTTDADCICGEDWIRTMVVGVDGYDMATGPIDITGDSSFLDLLQRYDNIATMITTYVGIKKARWYSANAANMIFAKQLYDSYQEEMQISHASGDDVMLLQWGVLNGFKANVVNDPAAIISTKGMETWNNFFRQRLRWASKSGAYLHQGLNYIWGFVFLYDLFLLISLAAMVWDIGYWWPYGLILLGLKTMGDAILLREGAAFYGYKYPLLLAPLLSIIHGSYVVIIGILSLFKSKYIWKEREVS